ncbi:hypothetical protein ACF3N0_00195 [Moraxella atlantae]|uniref:hypothetical protein n=1 Tax=Faucicola atlantae TaxID=34059 RepID=UPI003752CE8C
MHIFTVKKLPQFKDYKFFKIYDNYTIISFQDSGVLDLVLNILLEHKTPFILIYGYSETIYYGYDEELKYITNTKISCSHQDWISLQTNRYNQVQLLNLL